MKNNKRKGFTLVELLVVIAILAILATVSVVGYSAFIERANVSNDEQLATQLNNFLVAYMNDHSSEYYGETIDENNIRDITANVLELSGINDLDPQSKNNGYHFYFHFNGYGGGEYVVKSDKDVVKTAGINALLGTIRANAVLDVNSGYLGSCFTEGGEYFFVDTKGSDIADVINGLYTFNAQTDYEALMAKAYSLTTKDGQSIAKLIAYINSCVVVTDNGNYRMGSTQDAIVFVDNIKAINTNSYKFDGTVWAQVNDGYLANMTGEIRIPDSVGVLAGNSLIFGNGATVVINKTIQQVAEMAGESFTNAPIKLADGNTYYTYEKEGQHVISDKKDGTATIELPLEYTNPMISFSGTLSASTANKVLNVTSNNVTLSGYVAWDVGSFTIQAKDFVGGKDSTLPATHTSITWKVADESKKYISISGNKVTINYDSVKNISEMPAQLKLIGQANDVDIPDIEFVIDTVYLTGAYYTLNGESVSLSTITVYYAGNSDSVSLDFVQAVEPNMTVAGITLDYAPTINDTAPFEFNADKSALVLTDNNAYGSYELTIKTGTYSYLNKTVTVDLYNTDAFIFTENNSNLVFVGDDNAIKLGDLFNLLPGQTIPANAEVWVVKPLAGGAVSTNADDYFTANEYVVRNKIEVAANWANTEITFKADENTANDFTDANVADVIVLIVDSATNTRISVDHALTVVDGKNIYSMADLSSTVNNILVSNIYPSSDFTGFTLKNKTLYGNGFVIDFTKHDDTKKRIEALITLDSATLNNVKVIGNVYASDNFVFQEPTKSAYGASLILAKGTSTIKDAYLANTRSPLIVNGDVTVSDSVIFGGNYANVDVRGGKLTLTGDVITINQVIKGVTDHTVGLGIVVDVFAGAETKVDISAANLTQYNYISATNCTLLPVVTLTAELMGFEKTVTVDLGEEIAKEFNKDDLKPYLFTGYTSFMGGYKETKYLNAGIVFLNGITTNKESLLESALGKDIVDCGNDDFTKSQTQSYGSPTLIKPTTSDIPMVGTMTVTANIYFHMPTPDQEIWNGKEFNTENANNGINFDNDASEYLPSKYLPAN